MVDTCGAAVPWLMRKDTESPPDNRTDPVMIKALLRPRRARLFGYSKTHDVFGHGDGALRSS